MDIKELKELIDATIYPNGEKKIKASSHQSMLHEIVDYTNENITTINSDLEEVKNTLETQGNDVEQLKESSKQTELNDAKVNQKIDNLASNIVGLGGDIKGSAKGADVIELPSVAINGISPKTKIEGLTLVNVVKNGDFSDGVKQWGIQGGNIIPTTVGVEYNATGYLNRMWQRLDGVDNNNVVYLALLSKQTGVFYLNLWTSKISTSQPIDGSRELGLSSQLDFTSCVYEAKDITECYVGVQNREDKANTILVSYLISINLTQMFGKGNEPTKEWCDKHIKGYIDGVQSVQTPLRVKSVGANLFDYINDIVGIGGISYKDGKSSYTKSGYYTDYIRIAKGIFNTNINFGSSVFGYALYDSNKKYILGSTTNGVVDNSVGATYLRLTIPLENNSANWKYTPINEVYISKLNKYEAYIGSTSYINSETTLKSALKTGDYIENGTLFKNVFTTKKFKKDDIRRQYINESLVNTYAFYFDIEENVWLKEGFSDNANRIALFSDGETYSCVGSTIATDVEDIIFFIESGRNYIMLKINRSKIDGLAGATPLDKFKAYMGNRLLIINYQANTEQIKLDTSGIVTTKANGTIFVENIKNVTDFYTINGLEVKDFKELVSIYKYEGSDLVQLDASKAVFTTTLKHPDLIDGDLVFFEYKYLDSPLWGDNEIEYFNKNNVLQSENGKLWQKVEKASNEGVLTTELKEIV